ncbi:hypothetical protein DICA4_D30922 [Diutina catenulata]
MNRGGWSLADDLRKQEKEKQQRIQSRQRHQNRLAKLTAAVPAKLFYRLQKLQETGEDPKKTQELQADWDFIIKHGLHKDEVKKLLEKHDKDVQPKGKDSVYFNPELNPLGKAPPGFPNITKSQIKHRKPPTKDPLIKELGIVPPSGEPPKFYKKVYNAEQTQTEVSGSAVANFTPTHLVKRARHN